MIDDGDHKGIDGPTHRLDADDFEEKPSKS